MFSASEQKASAEEDEEYSAHELLTSINILFVQHHTRLQDLPWKLELLLRTTPTRPVLTSEHLAVGQRG